MSDQIQIADGTGDVNVKAKVNSDNQLHTFNIEHSAMYEASLDGGAYSWTSITSDIDTGDTALAVKNTSHTRKLVIQTIYVYGDVPTLMKVHCPVPVTLAGGAAVVGVNLNRGEAATLAPAIARSDETATTFAAGNVIFTAATNETTGDQYGVILSPFLDGAVVLGFDDIIAVDVIGEVAAYECTIAGYYVDL